MSDRPPWNDGDHRVHLDPVAGRDAPAASRTYGWASRRGEQRRQLAAAASVSRSSSGDVGRAVGDTDDEEVH